MNISVFTGACTGPHFALFIESTLTTIEKTEDSIVKDWDMDSEICNVNGLEGQSVRASKIAAGGSSASSASEGGGWLARNKTLVAGVAVVAVAAVAAVLIAKRKKE